MFMESRFTIPLSKAVKNAKAKRKETLPNETSLNQNVRHEKMFFTTRNCSLKVECLICLITLCLPVFHISPAHFSCLSFILSIHGLMQEPW